MRKNIGVLMGMAVALSATSQMPLGAAAPEMLKKKPKTKPKTEKEWLEEFRAREKAIDEKIMAYGEKRKGGTIYMVQGYFVKAINKKNAIKAIRKIMGEVAFRPELTRDEFCEVLNKLEKKVREYGES